MSSREPYYRRARDWAIDTQAESARSRRVAWTIAGIAVGAALFQAVALAMLAPLKSVEPVTILVDRQTGYVQALDPVTPRRVAADEALTSSFLAQYVTAREGFDRATVSSDYRRVALWSAGSARSTYLSTMPATNPSSPFQRYPTGTIVVTAIKSVSRLRPGIALVRFDTQEQGQGGRTGGRQSWISVVRFRYVDAPMSLSDRLVNPLGFQVLGYRRDAESPPLASPERADPVVASRPSTLVPLTNSPTSLTDDDDAPAARQQPSRPRRATSTIPPADLDRRSARTIPLDQLPMGSPLGPGPTGGSRSLVMSTAQ